MPIISPSILNADFSDLRSQIELINKSKVEEIVWLMWDIKDDWTLGNINRINNERVVTVKANVDETKIPGPVARAEAEKYLAQFPLPPGYTAKFTGEFEFQKESEEFLTKAFAIALFLIFLILVTQFNSVAQPFIIMTAVILSLGGAFLGLTVIGSPFGIIMTGVGVISLAGVVVNNGIVLVDYINKLRKRGYELREAVVAAGATASIRVLKRDQSIRERHQTQASILKLRLKGLGLPIIDHGSHIVPVIVGDPVHTKMLSDMLLTDYGIYVQPINFPTVPRGTERLRFTPSPVHGPREMDALVHAMDELWSHCALNRAELAG